MKKLLGDHEIQIYHFPNLGKVIQKLKEFKSSVDRKKSERVNRTLLELIQSEDEPCFLLPAVLEFVEKVDEARILHHYAFTSFELWLNQFSGLSFEDNYRVRAKIVGKRVDRSAYQNLFPIGMAKVHSGTHFITAHKSPDLDTTIASFWGWMDAFGAKVADGLHVWNVPDGPPSSQIEVDWIFRNVFGPAVFTHLPKTRPALTLTGNDLMKQKGLQRKTYADSIAGIEHDRDNTAVVVVDEDGFYLGDWRANDSEGVRQVIILLSSCLRWFENSLHLNLISIFSKEKLVLKEVKSSLSEILEMKVGECEPGKEFSDKQRKQVDDFLKLVLGMKGLESTFDELARGLCDLAEIPFGGSEGLIEKMKKEHLFDTKGNLVDNRPRIFSFLEEIIRGLHLGIVKIRARLEKLDIALKTKFEVFSHSRNTVTVRSDLEEIRNKMSNYSYLTVVYPDKDRLYPVGVIQATDLRKAMLGTVSLRDFCNRDEMGIPNYLEVISVIDHHKTVLNTLAPPMVVLSDAQSSNTLVAQKAFEINDPHSLLGQKPKDVESQIKMVSKKESRESTRLLCRLLNKRLITQKKNPYFIHPEREFLEYLHFLYGIIDDTDLLSKVSAMDVECVVSLLNRMKSLSKGKEVEILSLDELPRDRNFPKKAAEMILQNEDMYSLYAKVYQHREKEVEKNIALCAKGETSNLFADTKEQNGCCRVGQTKMFAANVRYFEKHIDEVRKVWLQKAIKVNQEKPEIDLHIHMISTIVNADEVYKGTKGQYSHQDELWIWIPNKETAYDHLRRFLSSFQSSPGIKGQAMEVAFLGVNGDELAEIFKESFVAIAQSKEKKNIPIAVLKYKPGILNSRKAMVSPFLPSLS